MTYHEFLTYLFDRDQTRELAVELGVAMDEQFAAQQATASLAASA